MEQVSVFSVFFSKTKTFLKFLSAQFSQIIPGSLEIIMKLQYVQYEQVLVNMDILL